MSNRRWAWALAVVVAMGMALGGVSSTVASPSMDKLPQVKNPSSVKFNITGSMTFVGGLAGLPGSEEPSLITGSGAISGNDYEITMTLKPPEVISSSSGDTTISTKMVGGKLYIQIPSPNGENKWYVTDVSAAGATSGADPITGLNPSLEDAYTIKELGKEEVDGVATTKYQIDVDLEKLLGATGTPTTGLEGSTQVMYWWVGDQDMYIHKVNYLSTIRSSSGDVTIELRQELTMTFYDFDVPVTITAPPDAEPIENLISSAMPGGMPISTTSPVLGMPVMAGMPGMTSAGMPKAGKSNGDNMPLALLALSMGLVLSGVAARRAAPAKKRA